MIAVVILANEVVGKALIAVGTAIVGLSVYLLLRNRT